MRRRRRPPAHNTEWQVFPTHLSWEQALGWLVPYAGAEMLSSVQLGAVPTPLQVSAASRWRDPAQESDSSISALVRSPVAHLLPIIVRVPVRIKYGFRGRYT